jgi:hypothetical protein
MLFALYKVRLQVTSCPPLEFAAAIHYINAECRSANCSCPCYCKEYLALNSVFGVKL